MKYPELQPIAATYPNPQIWLGRKIYWTEKRDGSQLQISWDSEQLRYETRYMEASEQFKSYFLSTGLAPVVEEFMRWHHGEAPPVANFNTRPVLFGELLVKGKSPARFEHHEKCEFVVFDIYSLAQEAWLPWPLVYQDCYHFGIPVVECWGESQHLTLESLLGFRDKMLEEAKGRKREGVVLKSIKPESALFAKEKLDTPPILYVHLEEGSPILPFLPESEVMGAVAKAHADLGERFIDKTVAMLLIAKYVKEEQKKHLCSRPIKKLYTAYLEYLEGLSGESPPSEELWPPGEGAHTNWQKEDTT